MGISVGVLATARFDAKPPDSLEDHLAQLDVPLQRHPPSKFLWIRQETAQHGRRAPDGDFVLNGVPVTMLMTKAERGSLADQFESQQFLFLLDDIFQHFRPDLLITYGGHPVVQEAMRRGQVSGATTVFSLHNRGYEDRKYFRHVGHVFTSSPFLRDHYREAIGLRSNGIEPPIDWQDVEAPTDLRKFVTFVNPSPAKGSMLFARIADMLGMSRPDIPILIVQSARGAGALNTIPASTSPVPSHRRRAGDAAASRFLCADEDSVGPVHAARSVRPGGGRSYDKWHPALVSDRGALPETVGEAGRVNPAAVLAD